VSDCRNNNSIALSLPVKREIGTTEYSDWQTEKEKAKEQEEETSRRQYSISTD
jgi:hypothetical protein